ncbi:hypothetical protein [Paraburkholderia sp. J8-2]|uniref:hypothetical protein n=1 Tax=Paraburkholderia sp. J8-2 TaxID=2805440 RepID=UPI002AB7AA40|nr:hypothetical protein [Paraburkholderia sp. J8-2]
MMQPVEFPDLHFLIEGGKALELCRSFVAERHRAFDACQSLARELGVMQFTTDLLDGTISRVRFQKAPHPDFGRADRNGMCAPRKGTEWETRFRAQLGHPNEALLIQEALGVPCAISYHNETGSGSAHVGNMLCECGFLYPNEKGPYAMWIPDVESQVARYLAAGFAVDEPAMSFKAEFEGCCRIMSAGWELLVAQYNHDAALRAA